MTEEAGRPGGLLDSLRNLARTFLAILQTRLEIARTELEEQGVLFARIAVLGAVAGVCFTLAVNLVVFFLVVVFWDSHRLAVIGGLALLFAAGGALAWAMLRAAFAARPRLFSATLAEFSKDRSGLQGK